MDYRGEPGLVEGGRQLVLQVLQAVEAAGLHLDAQVRFPQEPVRFGAPTPSAEIEGNPGTGKLRAGNELGADDHAIVVHLGPDEVSLRLPEMQWLGRLQCPDDVVERLQDRPAEAGGVIGLFSSVEQLPQRMGGSGATRPSRE
ncbi:hypothetical protein ACIRVK_45275 [Streptomyces sp. NPDC101152]|uniref:hypothetical protein n=1 Tax=Streptomyces sp. NPDC101152 TaxID=3366116 RepID=UPI0038028306